MSPKRIALYYMCIINISNGIIYGQCREYMEGERNRERESPRTSTPSLKTALAGFLESTPVIDRPFGHQAIMVHEKDPVLLAALLNGP